MNREAPKLYERFFGLVGGLITGLFISLGLFLILGMMLGIGGESDGSFLTYSVIGMSLGILLGIVYPKRMLKVGALLGSLIPGV